MIDQKENVREALELLRSHSDYRVLELFVPTPSAYLKSARAVASTDLKQAVYVDVETTGLNTQTCKIIELAVVPFSYTPEGEIVDVGYGASWLQDPGEPLSVEIQELTGLNNEDLADKRIPWDNVRALIADAGLVVAHNADYDRKVLERAEPEFREKPWACSYREIDWTGAIWGARTGKVNVLIEDILGLFADGHRALEDCHAGVALLANGRRESASAMAELLLTARSWTSRVWAVGSPFQKKDALKERKYRWSAKDDGGRNCWYKDVSASEEAEEVMFARDIGGARPDVVKFGARDRYSIRVG